MSSHSDTEPALKRQKHYCIGFLGAGGDEESVFEGGGIMERLLSMRAGDAPDSERDVSKIATQKPRFREPVKYMGPASSKVVRNTQPQQRANGASRSQRTLTDAQVLKVLENRRVHKGVISREAAGADVAILPPEDTNTRLVLREAVGRNSPVSFAVQLQWSVQPIDAKSVPGHPIFQAYTLYAAEGRRAAEMRV